MTKSTLSSWEVVKTYNGRGEVENRVKEVKRSIECLIRRIIKVAARVSYHGRRWWVHVASAFSLAHHFRAVLGTA